MRNYLKLLKKSSGFTLIELLVVIAIIGVLATVLLAAIDPLEQINKGNDGTVKSTVDNLYASAMTNAAINPTAGYIFAAVPLAPAGRAAYVTGLVGVPGTVTALTAVDVIACGVLNSKASGLALTFIACGGRKYTSTAAIGSACALTGTPLAIGSCPP